ncbi:MAG TPA: NUDIX domain-containing protein [Myxococcales bacterium]|nr:NUDIX domain-containing protein [Myxococcales bacterium]
MELKGIQLFSDERAGQGGHLVIRRLRMKLLLSDGSSTREGAWDFVERPMGLDAVVLCLWRKAPSGLEVLLRSGLRVPLQFGRAEPRPLLFTELVAGILEPGDNLPERAAAEALEEAGLQVAAATVQLLGPPLFPTPGMCAELFHFAACEVASDAVAIDPQGDGSPFEQGARLEWVSLDEAFARIQRGELQDLKTELALRRLRDELPEAKQVRRL